MFLGTHLIERLEQHLHAVQAVVHDLLLGLRNVIQRGPQKGWAHIHGHGFDIP